MLQNRFFQLTIFPTLYYPAPKRVSLHESGLTSPFFAGSDDQYCVKIFLSIPNDVNVVTGDFVNFDFGDRQMLIRSINHFCYGPRWETFYVLSEPPHSAGHDEFGTSIPSDEFGQSMLCYAQQGFLRFDSQDHNTDGRFDTNKLVLLSKHYT